MTLTNKDEDFVVVAGVEAFIAGWGMEEMLKRAEAYRQTGADATLAHSKRSDMTEIESFVKEWSARLPVMIVPTKYYRTPKNRFHPSISEIKEYNNRNLVERSENE
ncbi:isocitrate lyase/phosphoenolpyruvate mutase family protein [Paenibacillus cisolokensis]|uniref:isocitrate lyase/phosphoenolpyruvate mutase family protein n=1 Tax=Paenibacillus cisolokensis TaxID=1658519 RepID=UPI003D2AE084